MSQLIGMIERLGRALCSGLFLRIGPCHFDFETDRRGRAAPR